MQQEIWKDVVGYEDYFKISSLGNLFSKRTNKILKQHIGKRNRKAVSTRIGGRSGVNICFSIHRLVAEAFIPNPDNKPEVNHIDCDPLNNVVSNLEWATREENLQHWLNSEKFKNFDFSKLGNRTINYTNLLEDFVNSGLSMREFAEIRGCSYSGLQHAIKFIKTGRRYK